MDISAATSDAKDSALKDVANHLNKPDVLERLDQYKRKIKRKKTTIESQLRNAVQTQLDGVQKGLHTLQELEKVVKEVKTSISDVEHLYQDCSELSEVIGPIKGVNSKHQQLKTTTIHINNIFNVPSVVKETHELIEQDRLLEAHRKLGELEHTKDELFIQLYQSEDAFVDKNTSLHHYFEPLKNLSDALGQRLWLVMNRVTGKVLDEPSHVVTAVRIIEREEKTDELIDEVLAVRGIPKYQLPGRPKRWREKCFQMLEAAICNRYDELQVSDEEKLENKGWLTDYLSGIASYAYTDLQAMKEHGVKCFPPHYHILNFFVKHHHACLVKRISQIVSDDPNARDIIPLLIWVGDVRESFLETLDIDMQSYGPLIDPKTEVKLQARCQKQVESNVQDLVTKMIHTERGEMYTFEQPPEADINNHYYTSVGITLFQMVDQNLSVLTPLGMANRLKILTICLDSVMHFQKLYEEMLIEYHKKHLECQKKEPPFYLLFMIAAANNCRACIEFADQLKKRFKVETNQNTLDAEHEMAFKKIAEDFDDIAHFCCNCLVEVTFMDLDPVFNELFRKDTWLSHSGEIMGKIEATLYDYNTDFMCLKQAYHSYVIIEAQRQVMFKYMQAMLSKRVVFKKDKEREKAYKAIKEDAGKIGNFFLRLSHATNPKCTVVLEEMSELLRDSQDTLVLDIGGLAHNHPDIRLNHVVALLAMRGDLNKSLVQKLMQQTGLREQLPEEVQSGRGSAQGSASGVRVSAATRKKEEEKDLFQKLVIPNPYSLVGR